jgi:cyclopropane fatty-acyl-phospholipid synthase-like methyltransferase
MDIAPSRIFFLALELLLAAYFIYTLIAIAKGAAPIPSRKSTVATMLDLANLQPGEVLYDLGSGDGRILFAAAKRGARCYGFEINPFLCLYTKVRAFLSGVRNVSVTRENFWLQELTNADVVTAYLVPHLMERLKNKVRAELKPGTRIVLAVYPFPDWEPEAHQGRVYLYRV